MSNAELSHLVNDLEVLVTDLDETLFPPESQDLPDHFQESIKDWRDDSRTWVIATGRTREQLHLFYEDWHVHPDYYISRARFIHAWDEEDSGEPFAEWNKRMHSLTERQEEYSQEWMRILKEWDLESDVHYELEESFAIFDSAEHASKAGQYISEHVDDEFKVLRHRWFLIVIPQEVGKGKALDRLACELNWNSNRVLCVGDGMNDLDMFDSNYDFRKAAVSNAEEPVKDYIQENSGVQLPWPGGIAITKLLDHAT